MNERLIVSEVGVDEDGVPCATDAPECVAIEVTWLDDTGTEQRTYLERRR